MTYDLDLLPVDPVRDRLRAANKNGATLRELEKLTGIDRRELQRITSGKMKSIRRKTYRLIMERVTDDDVRAFTGTTLVPIDKAAQIVRSLSAQGWSNKHVQHILRNNTGNPGAFLNHLHRDKRVVIFKKNEDLLIWLAEQIGAREGPSAKSKNWARSRGHFPLRHYDSKGKLVESTLSTEQRRNISSV